MISTQEVQTIVTIPDGKTLLVGGFAGSGLKEPSISKFLLIKSSLIVQKSASSTKGG